MKSYSACKLAKKAYDEAIVEVDDVDKQLYEDSSDTMFIMEILRDNISVWTGNILFNCDCDKILLKNFSMSDL